MPDELRKFGEEALSEARRRDGVEGTLLVRDPGTGEMVTTILFRDQAALNAYQAWAKEKVAESEQLGSGEVSAGRVYADVIAYL